MAESIALFLKLNGLDIQGDNSQTSLDRENSIEVLSWSWAAESQTTSSGGPSGQRIMGEVKFVQRIDKSSPLLFKAFTNSDVALGLFKFYRRTRTETAPRSSSSPSWGSRAGSRRSTTGYRTCSIPRRPCCPRSCSSRCGSPR